MRKTLQQFLEIGSLAFMLAYAPSALAGEDFSLDLGGPSSNLPSSEDITQVLRRHRQGKPISTNSPPSVREKLGEDGSPRMDLDAPPLPPPVELRDAYKALERAIASENVARERRGEPPGVYHYNSLYSLLLPRLMDMVAHNERVARIKCVEFKEDYVRSIAFPEPNRGSDMKGVPLIIQRFFYDADKVFCRQYFKMGAEGANLKGVLETSLPLSREDIPNLPQEWSQPTDRGYRLLEEECDKLRRNGDSGIVVLPVCIILPQYAVDNKGLSLDLDQLVIYGGEPRGKLFTGVQDECMQIQNGLGIK